MKRRSKLDKELFKLCMEGMCASLGFDLLDILQHLFSQIEKLQLKNRELRRKLNENKTK